MVLPRQFAIGTLDFGSRSVAANPERLDELVEAVFEEIAKLKADGPADADLPAEAGLAVAEHVDRRARGADVDQRDGVIEVIRAHDPQ